jgi:hypothetical protein
VKKNKEEDWCCLLLPEQQFSSSAGRVEKKLCVKNHAPKYSIMSNNNGMKSETTPMNFLFFSFIKYN